MKPLTLRKAIRLHRKMWRWIARNTRRKKLAIRKSEYFHKFRYLVVPESECYMCEYAAQQNRSKNGHRCVEFMHCTYCPLNWGNEVQDFMCEEGNGLYKLWRITEDPIKRAEYADKIANLPLKDSLKKKKRRND